MVMRDRWFVNREWAFTREHGALNCAGRWLPACAVQKNARNRSNPVVVRRGRLEGGAPATLGTKGSQELAPPNNAEPLSEYLTRRRDVVVKRSADLSTRRLKALFPIFSLVPAVFWTALLAANAQVNVTQFHNHSSRDGLYIDPAFTQSAAAKLTRDLNFDGTIDGEVYAQPLYIDNGPGGRATIIAATESNNVYALDAVDGSIIWQRNVGLPVSFADLPCPPKFDVMGITGTPVVDLASRALFLDAMTTPDGGNTKQHLILSLNLDTGLTNPGWPVDVNTAVPGFPSANQSERGGLALVNGRIYVSYSG